MEYLTEKPYYLTDEDILWVGSTLADLMPVECANAEEVRARRIEGRATVISCYQWDETACTRYASCIEAGVLFIRIKPEDTANADEILIQHMGFNGLLLSAGSRTDESLREEIIKILSLQAALGLHKM